MLNIRKRFSALTKNGNNKHASAFPPHMVFKSGVNSISGTDIDEQFYGVLLGATSRIETELNPFEKNALQQITGLIQKKEQAAKLIPRLPTILPKVIQALRIETVTADEIASLIEQDHVLVGDVMRLVNSPYYRTRQEITSLKQATIMLGREGLRQLVASAIVRPLMISNSGHFAKLSSRQLWEHSEKTALAVVQQCTEDEEMRFYAFLAGILQNIGFTVGFNALDSIFDGSHAPNSKQFLQLFIARCRELSAEIAKNWSLPDAVCEAFETMIDPTQHPEAPRLATTLYIADRIAKAQMLGPRVKFDASNAKILLNRKSCDSCLETLGKIDYKA